jgi:sugar lactone lactonase YvrE
MTLGNRRCYVVTVPEQRSGSLTLDNRRPVQGDPITFTYATTKSHVSKLNWIGLYTDPGNGPIHQRYVGPSLIWQYTPHLSGTATFSTSTLNPGDHIAFYLYDDGYTWLAKPLTFVVRAAPRVPPPTYRGAFGGPGAGTGQLAMPSGLGIGPDRSIWVADSANNRVQAFTRTGKPSRVIGEGVLRNPCDVALDGGGDVYVADSDNQRIARFTAAGDHVRDFGNGRLDNPRGVVVDRRGRVYASDTGHGRILVFDGTTRAVVQVVKGKMSSPQGLTFADDGTLWVAQNSAYSEYAAAVVGYSPDGEVVASLGGGVSSEIGGLSNPSYVAVDDAATLFVTLGDYGWTSMFSTNGRFLGTFGSQRPDTMRFPSGIALSGKDMYVADAWSSRILRYEVVDA